MRPTKDPTKVQFVADADSLDPYGQKDLNHDGKIDNADHLSPPGELYDITNDSTFTQLLKEGGSAYADAAPYSDQWGTFITATAPIRDDVGNIQAMIGVDIVADELYELTNNQFRSILYFVFFFSLLLISRFAAFEPKMFGKLISLLGFGNRKEIAF